MVLGFSPAAGVVVRVVAAADLASEAEAADEVVVDNTVPRQARARVGDGGVGAPVYLTRAGVEVQDIGRRAVDVG
jgi:hypothetical protein